MLWATVLKFLMENRRGIAYAIASLIVVGAIAYGINHVLEVYYKKGLSQCDGKWVVTYNREIEARNKRIHDLELESVKSAKKLSDTKDTAQKLVDGIYAKWQADKAKGKVKVIVQCPEDNVVHTPNTVVLPAAPDTVAHNTNPPLTLNLDTKDIVLPPDYISTWNALNHASGKEGAK